MSNVGLSHVPSSSIPFLAGYMLIDGDSPAEKDMR